MVNIAGLRTPYDYANPVQADEVFAGRHTELAKIGYLLDQAGTTQPVGYVALHGQRAAGKTSLLNKAELLARNRSYLPVRINLVPANAEPARFFATMYEELIGAVSKAGDLATPDGRKITPRLVRRIIEGGAVDDDFPLEFPENLAHAGAGGQISEMALRNDLEYLLDHVGRPIVLLIDEAQLIADRPDVLSMLRTLGMRLHGYVLVLAGTPELLDRIREVFDHLLRQFEFVKVERFAESDDVQHCMTLPLESLRLTPAKCFSERIGNVAVDLMRLTDGNPYEIQLFCHIMFARWQTGLTDQMELSPEALDDVRATLGIGSQDLERPLVSAVQRMSEEALRALNVWCSSLECATLDELRFSYRLGESATMDDCQLDRYLDQFIQDGLVEVVDGRVRLTGDSAAEVYARLSTVKRLGNHHPRLISRFHFHYLLSHQLDYFLCDSMGGVKWLLRTCCLVMDPKLLDQGLSDLEMLPTDRPASFTVEFLHDAILKAGMPAALDLTTVECSYHGTKAVRWICRPDIDQFDLNSSPAFILAQERVATAGGQLHAERTRLPLKPPSDIVDWLVARVEPQEARRKMSMRHVTASYASYGNGDITATIKHLDAAFRLFPHWDAGNNIAYINLISGDYIAAREWAQRALPLAENPAHKALSHYNGAIAAAQDGDLTVARELLTAAATDLAERSTVDEDDEYEAHYLLIPKFEADHIEVREEESVELADAVATATEIIEFAERFNRLRGST
jgi:hypothetical protein